MNNSTAKILAACTMIAALLTSSCTGVRYSYRYADLSKPYPWGSLLIRLMTQNNSYKDGVSIMAGPYNLVVSAWLNNGAALPPSCVVKYQSVVLHREDGSVEVEFGPEDIPPRVANYGTAAEYRPDPSGQALAAFLRQNLDLPYKDYLVAVDFRLEGCGEIDGAYRLREVMRAAYRKQRFSPAWSAIMSV